MSYSQQQEGEGTMYKRILKTLMLALAVSVVAPVGSALGMVMTDGGGVAVVQQSKPLVSEKLAGLNLASQVSTPIVSEKLAGLNVDSQVSTPIVSEKLAGLQLSQAETVSASAGTGFDWSDAGIGAGVMFASLLALSAGAITLRRHHHRPIAH
jgi:hypothetical protein